MKPKFTPGPYEARTEMDGRHHALPIMTLAPEFNRDDEKEPHHPLIAQVLHGRGHAPREVAEATAKLFAAAPELYGALNLALEYWAHRQQRYKNRSPVWVEQARAAIAKVLT